MFKKLKKKLRNNNGFTILELIVVIAIMGFLVALVAPKLVDVASKSDKPVAVTNMQRLHQAVQRHIEETGTLPNSLDLCIPPIGNVPINVRSNSWPTRSNFQNYAKDAYYDDFFNGNRLYLHILNKEEVQEIKKLGITKIIDYYGIERDLEKYYKEVTTGENTEKKPEGIAVLMIGNSITSIDKTPHFTLDEIKATEFKKQGGTNQLDDEKDLVTGNKFLRPELIYRIVLGIGEDSDLAKKGLLKNVGKDPLAIRDKDSNKVSDYALVLPRLQSTLDRVLSEDDEEGINKYINEVLMNNYTWKNKTDTERKERAKEVSKKGVLSQVIVDGYSEHLLGEEGRYGVLSFTSRTGNEKEAKDAYNDALGSIKIVRERVIELKAQEINDFAIIGPGDAKYPESDVAVWEVKGFKYRDGDGYGPYDETK